MALKYVLYNYIDSMWWSVMMFHVFDMLSEASSLIVFLEFSHDLFAKNLTPSCRNLNVFSSLLRLNAQNLVA